MILALMLLAGCSLFGKETPPAAKLESVRVIAFPAANRHMAVAVDIVFAYDRDAVALLPKEGPDWFERRAAILNGAGNSIETLSYELPPDYVLAAAPLPARYRKAQRVVAYVNHVEPEGQHALNLTGFRRALVWLDATAAGASDESDQRLASDRKKP